MTSILKYEEFANELNNVVYKKAKFSLINNIASSPYLYIGVFSPTIIKAKLIQSIGRLYEVSFGDFIEDIITNYLGKYYSNLNKRVVYRGKTILFDQLFLYNDKIFMIEQKMRDDHDSTKKVGQFDNFLEKVSYLKETYPELKCDGELQLDVSLLKNKKYYLKRIEENQSENVKLHLFYGDEFTKYLEKETIWDEMVSYLLKWKTSLNNNIELNFEKDWNETKKELLENVSKNTWKKLISNERVVKEILPELFPTGKYKEILDELNINKVH